MSLAGNKLILSSRNAEELEKVRSNLENPELHAVEALDLSDNSSLFFQAQGIVERHEGIDVLINNAGISQRSLALEIDLEDERQLMEINFFGTLTLTRSILPSMIKRQKGQIVVVSSLLGKMGIPGRAGYAASKHALHGYMDALRTEICEEGIIITLACPGYVETRISENAVQAKHKSGMSHTINVDRTTRGMPPEDCAKAIIEASEAQKEEVYIGGPEKLAVIGKRFSPKLLNKLIRWKKT